MGTIADQLNTAMRDFVRFTGDGLPGEPVGRPLPQGDPASGQFNPPKKQVREAFLAIAETADNLNETAEAVTADRVQTGADRAAVSAYTAASLTYRDQAQNAALAVGAPIVTALTSPVPADGTIEVLQTGAGGQVWQVADGAWGGADGKPVGWLTKPEFPDIATMAASSGFVNGQEITANGEPFEYKSEGERDADGDPVTADGALVVDAVGMETGQFVSKRAEYADYDEVKADPRSFTAGKVLKLRGIEGTLTATDGSGNWNGKTAGGQAFDTSSVTGDVRLWGAAGASDDTAALQAAIAASDKITLGASHVLTGRMNLKDWQLIEGYNQSKIQMQAGNTILPILAVTKQGLHLKNFRLDGASGGQLDAGLIQINGCSDFLIEDVNLENGGTIAAASPQGVNGFSFATDAYPTGSKSSGRISRVTTRNFTKAPFNWTTFAEGGVLTDSEFYDSVGNGQTPGIQVNGGRKLKAQNNLVDGTEGAGVAIASVGTTPAYASQDIELSFNTYRRIGELGQTNSEQFVYLISDGQAAGDLQNIHISNEVIEGCAGGILKTGGNVSKIRLDGIRSRNTQGGYDLQNVDDVKLTRLIVEDFNSDNNASLPLFSLRGASNIAIDGADINSEGLDMSGQIFSCTAASSGVRVRNLHYQGGLKLISTTSTDFLTDAIIEATTDKVSAAGANTEIQLLKVPNGRTLQADVEISTASGSVFAAQRLKVSVDAAAGTATIRENALLFNSKAGITTGLSADIDSSNVLRIRFLNSSASELVLQTKIRLVFD